QLDRDVALKLLRKDLGPEYANQLQQEARITASVNHPHVVQVFSFGRDHDQYYLVMELVDRGTLDDLIAEQKKLPEADALRAGIEVARGLRAAYQKGLIHRDVKPANILFNAEGMAKISDFGLAGIVEPNAQTSGAIWGTPYYVAPERSRPIPVCVSLRTMRSSSPSRNRSASFAVNRNRGVRKRPCSSLLLHSSL